MSAPKKRRKMGDYSGVPSVQLAAVVERYRDPAESFSTLAQRAGEDPAELRRTLKRKPGNNGWLIGLNRADRLLLAMDLFIQPLVETGELEVLPMREGSARRMAEDEQWAAADEKTQRKWTRANVDRDLLVRRVGELIARRKELVAAG